jgi:chromosome segregation ATPase
VAKLLSDVLVKEVSLVPAGANGKRIFLTKAAPTPDTGTISEETPVAQAKNEPETVSKADLDALATQIQEIEKSKASMAAELVSIRKAADEAAQKNVELQKALDAEKESKEIREAVTKHAEQFKNLPGKAEDVAPALRVLRKAAPESAKVVEDLLKSVDALIGQGKTPLDPVGSAASAAADATEDAIEKAVAEIRKADPTLSPEKAFVLALEKNPDLYGKAEKQ